ncbi:hypothetical protein PH586_09100 [Pseudomonas sp. SA3-5]|uniref:Uncharacterized protein n=1 Tax=Pseudomonas aestuarii TaxID=3018340 RepID=A0ABT4XE92_9PSED|nr:hypothetical protein [Pseudomonas aestuarii]MDA7086534.1 hypothetical protein [Pseudomonas aestuarii]
MSDYFYKSAAPAVVAIVRDFYTQKDALNAGLLALGQLFGGAVAPMRDITGHYAGGVKLSASRELDVHWRRPDDYGYRALRVAATPAKGTTKEERAAIRAEHERLLGLWRDHCPPRLSAHKFWGQLGVNTGSLMMCGGIKFELDGTAYFHLGFAINEAEHLAEVAACQPTAGWIEGAVEIVASEFQAARHNKLEQQKEVASA